MLSFITAQAEIRKVRLLRVNRCSSGISSVIAAASIGPITRATRMIASNSALTACNWSDATTMRGRLARKAGSNKALTIIMSMTGTASIHRLMMPSVQASIGSRASPARVRSAPIIVRRWSQRSAQIPPSSAPANAAPPRNALSQLASVPAICTAIQATAIANNSSPIEDSASPPHNNATGR